MRRKRIQQTVVEETLLRRWLGLASVEVETAGTRQGKDPAERAELFVPVVPASRIEDLVQRFVPELPASVFAMPLRPAHPRSLLRARIRSGVISLLVAGAATYFYWPTGALAWGLLPVQFAAAWFDWKFQGWLVTDDLVIARMGFWRRRTTILQRARIQSVRAVQGPLERGYGIGHVEVAVAGSKCTLPCVGWEEAQQVLESLPARRVMGAKPVGSAPNRARPSIAS